MNIMLIKIKDNYHRKIDNTFFFFASCMSAKRAEETSITFVDIVQVTGILLNLMFHPTDISQAQSVKVKGFALL